MPSWVDRSSDDRLPAVVDHLALDVGRLARRRARHEVDAARQAIDEVAALREQREVELLQHDRDRLLDRLGDAAVLDQQREQAVAARDPGRQREPDQRLALLVGLDR
jgi:hypothetical protein